MRCIVWLHVGHGFSSNFRKTAGANECRIMQLSISQRDRSQ